MANTQIAISKNGKTTLATAGKYCARDIDINVAVASVADNIPDYIKVEADSAVSKVVSAQGSRVFTLAAITDLHYGNGSYTDGILHAAQALTHINKQITLDAFAVLGDYTDGYPVDSVDNAFGDCRKVNSLLSPMEVIPNLRIQGNHDFYNGYAQFVHYHIQAYSEGVTWGDKVGGYFYRDFADKKLRIICVNTTEIDNANIGVSTTQYTWFVNALDLSAKSDAEDWQILVLSHHPLDWYVTDGTYRFAYIMEAYKNGTSGTVGGVSYNFAGKNSATLIGNIHGHVHNLLTGYINKGNVNTSNPTNVLRICTPEACINRANQYDGAWKETTSYNKTTNSAKDTSFVVYCIDLDSQNIKAFCYGAGYDREISYAPVAPTVYTITNSLTNCTASGAGTIVEDGTAAVTVTANSGYDLPDTITVSGASYTWDKSTGTVVLSNPTGNVTITVVGVKAAPKYTNLIPLSTDSSGNLYNGGKGWKADTRLNSSGAEAAYTGIEVTGFIPVKLGDVIYLKNVGAYAHGNHANQPQQYFAVYDANKNKLESALISYLNVDGDAVRFENNDLSATGRKIIQINTANAVSPDGSKDWRKSNMAYFRISAAEITDDSIITVNEPIDVDDSPNIETPNYTNQIPLSINADGSQFVGTNGEDGYKIGYRMNSSGTETQLTSSPSANIVGVTGYIPIKTGDTVYLKNISMHRTNNSGENSFSYISLFKSDFSSVVSSKTVNINDANNAYIFGDAGLITDSNGYVTSFTLYDKYNTFKNGGYLRISAPYITDNSIITVNEPIE